MRDADEPMMPGSPTNAIEGIPEPSLRRLPAYHQVIQRYANQDIEFVSCTQIGQELNLDPTQVRKDLALAGACGRPKVGYSVKALYRAIEHFLGWDNAQDAVLVGTGHLGQALLGYTPLEQYGVKIIAAFDKDPRKWGSGINGKIVFPVEKMPNLLERMHVRIGILTVPAGAAQDVCNLMTLNGILAIWNFAPIALTVPEGVIVQSEDLFSSLGILSSKLAAILRCAKSGAPLAEVVQ